VYNNTTLYNNTLLYLVGTGGSIAVCISPLMAIMAEHTAKLNSLGIETEFVRKQQTNPDAQRRVIKEEVQIVLTSPESILFNASFRNALLSARYKH